jgi:FtsP/CotA-like multicopper oxidase with cupredoxin domain
MDRREFVRLTAGVTAAHAVATLPRPLCGWLAPPDLHVPRGAADVTLRIAPAHIEIGPGRVVKTTAYNGMVPGPLIRVPEGRPTTIEVSNATSSAEWVHWHGLVAADDVDGAGEEGTPRVAPGETRQYIIVPRPAGTRWYHTHTVAGQHLDRAMYTGQFGFLYIEPQHDPGGYDDEVFLALHGWEGYLGTGAASDETLDVIYKSFTVNARMLGAGDPIRVHVGERVMFRILNASATQTHRLALPGHRFAVVALDGNPVPTRRAVGIVEVAPGERVDAIVMMNQPGVWALGEVADDVRGAGLGVVVEYAGQSGAAQWTAPARETWDYTQFGTGETRADTSSPSIVSLVFRKKFAGSRWVDNWTVNDKSFPHTDPIRLALGARYRLRLDNRSDEAHPVHLHRNTFEVVTVAGRPTRGVYKDVIVVPPSQVVEVDLTADAAGASLLHCHNQLHMDYGFMTVIESA